MLRIEFKNAKLVSMKGDQSFCLFLFRRGKSPGRKPHKVREKASTDQRKFSLSEKIANSF